MNEVNELTLKILKHTQISDVETAEETAEIIINTLGYHKKTEKVSPEAIILALDIDKALLSQCEPNCDSCRYFEFQMPDGKAPSCESVKFAEALLKLGWTNENLRNGIELNVEPINCTDCKYLKILNKNYLYGICQKTGFEFTPFKTDTRTHTCQFAELKETPNGSID